MRKCVVINIIHFGPCKSIFIATSVAISEGQFAKFLLMQLDHRKINQRTNVIVPSKSVFSPQLGP